MVPSSLLSSSLNVFFKALLVHHACSTICMIVDCIFGDFSEVYVQLWHKYLAICGPIVVHLNSFGFMGAVELQQHDSVMFSENG